MLYIFRDKVVSLFKREVLGREKYFLFQLLYLFFMLSFRVAGITKDENRDKHVHCQLGTGGHYHWTIHHSISVSGSTSSKMEPPRFYVCVLSFYTGRYAECSVLFC